MGTLEVRKNTEPFREIASSHATACSSVRCVVHDIDHSTPGYTTRMNSLRLWLPLEGSTEVTPGGTAPRYTFTGTQTAILPPNARWQGSWCGSMRCLLLEVAPSILQECETGSVMHPADGEIVVADDPQLRHLMLALYHALQVPQPAINLFAQHIGRAVAARYLQQYCTTIQGDAPKPNKLNRGQMDHLKAFIESHLHDKLTLESLAQALELSVTAFCRRFKQTTGIPPYRYVLQMRVDKAKRELYQCSRPLSEIALSLGFYDQSQFTNTFRRIVGLSPSKYRKRHSS